MGRIVEELKGRDQPEQCRQKAGRHENANGTRGGGNFVGHGDSLRSGNERFPPKKSNVRCLPRINILKNKESLRIQHSIHGLQLVEDHTPEVDVVGCPDQENDIKVPTH